MNHKEFLASLPTQTRQALLQKSDRAGLLHLVGHWGAILLVGGLIALEVPYWGLLLPIQGVLLIFNFTLLHECTHKTPFKTGWLNEVVGWITGFLVGLPFLWFRYFHLAHHKYTNDPKNDPELVGHPKPDSWGRYVWHVSGLPVWAAQIRGLIRIAAGRDQGWFIPKSARIRVRVESIIIVIFYVVTLLYSLTISTMAIKVWIIPAILGQPFLRLYLLAEHGRCPQVADMLQNSRTVFTNWAVKFVAWNMPFHAEHHTYPSVPFWRLPALHSLMQDHLKTTENGYTRFHSTYVTQLSKMG